MTIRRLVLVAALGVACLLPATASAQSKRARAREHFKQAEAYMRTKAYAKAIAEYESAFELVPKAGFVFNVALAYEEWGKEPEALEHYDKYLGLEPNGRASKEARARAAVLRDKLEAQAAAAAKIAARDKQIETAVDGGRRAMAAKDYDAAIEHYVRAYELSQDPDHVFVLAEAYRGKGDKLRAIVEYERYRALVPGGARNAEALRHITAFKRELEHAADPKIVAPPEPVVKKNSSEGLSWTWVAIGAAVVGAGVAADVIPEAGDNGQWDATDFIPVGLYGLGGLFVYRGVF